MQFVHFDEAKRSAIETILEWLKGKPSELKVMLIADLFGRLRLAYWNAHSIDLGELNAQLESSCGTWWAQEIAHVSDNNNDITLAPAYKSAWELASLNREDSRLRVVHRHRSRTAWFSVSPEKIWNESDSNPPVVVFYSFKGGLGRSTLLASFAIQRARAGERVCVIDLDLDSPGIGRVLSADDSGLTARWGVVDYLLEGAIPGAPLADYFHRCDRVSGSGEILVFPAGIIDDGYADKLARADLEEAPNDRDNILNSLLDRIRVELNPNWILLDARTGISEPAGYLLSGIAHLHVLLGAPTNQSWQGLGLVLDRLGKERVLSGRSQCDIALVHAMVPTGELGKIAREAFEAQAEREFDSRYYAEDDIDPDKNELFWTLGDKGSLDAPHTPLRVRYDQALSGFDDVSSIADRLCEGDYLLVSDRITNRFLPETE